MFADSLCDATWAQTSRRGWTTLASFALQALAVGVLLLLPLIYTEGLPQLKWISTTLPVPAPPPPPAQPPTARTSHQQSNLVDGRPVTPPTIPDHVAHIQDQGPPPSITGSELGVRGGTGDPRFAGVFSSLGTSTIAVAPPPPKPVARPPRPSVMMQGYLVYRVEPVYPPLARAARIQGRVQLQAIIGRDGRIENLRVLEGHPMLVQAARDAVSRWRYRPYILNGESIEVETLVTVNFVLSGN
jgi:periplasmic protein TonB